MPLAAAGGADLGAGVHEPHQRQRAQAALGRERAVGPDRVALDRDQEVHRDRRHLELAQAERHLHHVVAGLPHAHDEPAAGLDPALLGRRQGPHAVRVGVGAADLGVVALARVQVVVEAVEARLGEDARVLLLEQPGREADLDGEAALDLAHQLREPARPLQGGAPAREHHAVAPGARPVRGLRLPEDLRVALHRVLADRGRRVARLRAVAAVLRTQAVLHVVQDVHHHAAPEVTPARHVRGL